MTHRTLQRRLAACRLGTTPRACNAGERRSRGSQLLLCARQPALRAQSSKLVGCHGRRACSGGRPKQRLGRLAVHTQRSSGRSLSSLQVVHSILAGMKQHTLAASSPPVNIWNARRRSSRVTPRPNRCVAACGALWQRRCSPAGEAPPPRQGSACPGPRTCCGSCCWPGSAIPPLALWLEDRAPPLPALHDAMSVLPAAHATPTSWEVVSGT